MLLTTLIFTISSFVGGILMTGGIIKITNNFIEQREMDRRTEELYLSFIEEDNKEI